MNLGRTLVTPLRPNRRGCRASPRVGVRGPDCFHGSHLVDHTREPRSAIPVREDHAGRQRRSFGGRGGPAQTSDQQQSVGTVISVTASVDGDAIVVRLNVEKSQLERRESKSEADDEFVPSGTETLTSQVTVRIENGKTVLASGLETRADTESSAQFILASAGILELSTDTKSVATADGMDARLAERLKHTAPRRTMIRQTTCFT